MNNKNVLLSLAAASLLVACGGDDKDQTISPPVAKASELKILHINDHHSNLDPKSMTFEMALGADEKQKITVESGGFARVAALFKALSENQSNVLKLHAGDAITGDLYYNLTEGEADAQVMNSICFDSFTLGNHEFDSKDAGLKTFIDFLDKGSCQNKTEILSANVSFGESSPLYKTNRIKKSHVFERNGEKYAVIGLTIAAKTKNSSQPNQDTMFSDEIETAQKEIDVLKKQGINKIILQTHTGYDLDKKLATSLTDVDVIIGGDSHSLLGPESMSKYGLSPEGDYPTQLRNKDGDPVCVVQAWQYSAVVGELNVKFDADGKVTSCEGTPHVLMSDQFNKVKKDADGKDQFIAATEAETKAILAKFKADSVPFTMVKPDQATVDIIAPFKQEKEKFAKAIVGQVTENLCLRRVPGTERDATRSALGDVCNKNASVNAHGGDIQQIIAEAFLTQGKEYFKADISIQNGGGVRVDLATGDLSVEKIYQVLPFDNTLFRLDMTGAEIKATLEDAMDGVHTQNNTGSYPYTGGLRWHVDLNQAKGQRLSQLEVRNAQGQYEAIDLNKTYRVVTIDFLANGGDFYTTMKSITGDRRLEVGLVYAQAFLQYVDKLEGAEGKKQLKKLPLAYYSTQKFTDAPKYVK